MQLDKIARELIPDFAGVFPRDQIPELEIGQSIIVNEDDSHGRGIHWMAMYKGSETTLFYDSFARHHNKVINTIKEMNVTDADMRDREQKIDEYNCGQRSISFLICVHLLGEDYAELI
jgi:hypothetical protein